ncbi:unnamed protein product, partial [Mesorhabditis belari]|uniref:Fungal lipase-like domain-containing protein n=1 Tax=Mesorhabditis belari TaxID=2138241 RepID=A0AAF3F1V4_9BILA
MLKRTKRAPQYNEQEARKYFQFSAAAYAETPEKCLMNAFPMNENRQLINIMTASCDVISSLCSGYIVKSDSLQELTIVFRGTKTQEQLLLEGWSTLTPQKDFFGIGSVNAYFFRAHNLLWDSVGAALMNPAWKKYRVVFTGHSLGAALAALAAARTVAQNLRAGNQVKVITFGEPRVGSVIFAKNFDQMIPDSWRIVFRKDVVAHLPGCVKDFMNGTIDKDASLPCDPNNLIRSYHHSTEIWYPECMEPGCQYRVCTGLPKGEDFSCSDLYKFDLAQSNSYIWDHRHYFGIKITEYGKLGCDASAATVRDQEPNGNSFSDKIFSAFDWVANRFGINV